MVVTARRGCVLLLALSALASFGCTSVPTFASTRDAGERCSTTSPCPAGQSCLQGVCYAACDTTHPCSGRETCTMGVCTARTTDAGMIARDAGSDGGFCETMACATPTPVCRGEITMCTQCGLADRNECGASTGSVCDVGRGTCTGAPPVLCGPCNVTADCPTGLTCVTRTSPNERVCLPSCATAACADRGFTCLAMQCIPFVGSCTAHRAAVARRTCATDTDCPQLGASVDDGLVTHMCGMASGADAGGALHCRAACGLTTDCPTGMTCGADHFCE